MMQMFALFDKKAATYGGVLLAASEGHCARIVQERFVGSGDTVEKYPEDFDLYSLGEYSVDTGVVSSSVKFVVNLATVMPGRANG